MTKINHTLPPELIVKSASTLHCTANVVTYHDHGYETLFGLGLTDVIVVTDVVWDKRWAAGAVQLNEQQEDLFQVPNSVPHVSLASFFIFILFFRQPDWKQVGPWLKSLVQTTDWTRTSETDVMLSTSRNA